MSCSYCNFWCKQTRTEARLRQIKHKSIAAVYYYYAPVLPTSGWITMFLRKNYVNTFMNIWVGLYTQDSVTSKPLNPWGGPCTPRPLPWFLPFTQNTIRQPIPENSWPCKTFCCGSKILLLHALRVLWNMGMKSAHGLEG